MSSELRVWVGCLACYNAGRLVGDWVAAEDAAEFRPHLHTSDANMNALDNAHEETWCFDLEGFPQGTGEMSPMEATAIAEHIASFQYVPVAALFALADNNGQSVTDVSVEDFYEAYAGEWDSEREFAYQLAEDVVKGFEDASWPFTCVDWDHAWNELRIGGDYWSAPAPAGGVFVFRSI